MTSIEHDNDAGLAGFAAGCGLRDLRDRMSALLNPGH